MIYQKYLSQERLIRPIFFSINDLTYNLAEYMVKLFSSFKKLKNFFIKKKQSFIYSLSSHTIHKKNDRLVSFDIISFFLIL